MIIISQVMAPPECMMDGWNRKFCTFQGRAGKQDFPDNGEIFCVGGIQPPFMFM